MMQRPGSKRRVAVFTGFIAFTLLHSLSLHHTYGTGSISMQLGQLACI